MSALEIIGGLTVAGFGILVSILVLEIVGNIYGGIKGAYRFRAILCRNGRTKGGHWPTIKLGLKGWSGMGGTYWMIGEMEVPVDGRKKIDRKPFYGA